MRILLDENLLSKKFKRRFSAKGYDVQNVEDMGWRGLKDQEILRLAEQHFFDGFITADKNLCHQQNLTQAILRIVVLDARSTRPDYLLPLMEKIAEIMPSLGAGTLISINDLGEIASIN